MFYSEIISFSAFVTHLATQWNIQIPPNPTWYCNIANTVLFSSFLCSTLLILSMTFGRFYSVVQPHRAASFNTVKRAKITIFCIILFSILYNIPHLFISTQENWRCLPYGKALGISYGQFYYWFYFVLNFALPFVLLLYMNSVIIHKIRNRSVLTNQPDGTKGKTVKASNSEAQIFAILLLVTFGFLILTTPGYICMLYIMIVDFFPTSELFAGYHFFYSFASKLHMTNHGINFFLYVISGHKFRADLIRLFRFRSLSNEMSVSSSTEMSTVQ